MIQGAGRAFKFRFSQSCAHTVQDDANQGLAVVVEDLPQCKGFLRGVGQQAEQDGEGVV